MRTLLVFRHAKAAREPGVADHERPLTDRGRRNARAMGEWLAAEGFIPDHALVSDAKRTRQTFQHAREKFPERLRTVNDPDLYLAEESTLLDAVRHVPDSASCVLLCGHNPSLHDFTTGMVGAGEREALDLFRAGMPTAAVAVLALDLVHWRDAHWRSAKLLRFVTPASITGEPGDSD